MEKAARVVGIDQGTDIAVLRIRAHLLRFIDLSQAVGAKQGEISLALGNPYEMGRTVTHISTSDEQMWRE